MAMQTETGKVYAEVYDVSALRQISDWCAPALEALKEHQHNAYVREGLEAAKPYMEDIDAFRMLEAAIAKFIR